MKEVSVEGIYILLIWIAVFFVLLKGFFMVLKSNKRRRKIKKWAKLNGLNYKNKARLPFVRTDSSAFLDVIWGQCNGQNIYFFDIFLGDKQGMNSSFLNGKCYEFLVVDEIEDIVKNRQLHTKKEAYRMCENIRRSAIRTQILIAQLFLRYSIEAQYIDVKKVIDTMFDQYKQIDGIKNKFNTPEIIEKLSIKLSGEIDDKIIRKIPALYQEILDTCK